MSIIYTWPTWFLITGLLALMFGANELGYRWGRFRNVTESERSRAVSSTLKTSTIGLVALLLGFTFSMTTNRFADRQRLVLDEANGIGTCYLRAGLLDDESSRRIRDTLRHYTDLRLEYFERALDPAAFERTSRGMDVALADLWNEVQDAAKSQPQVLLLSQLISAANDVIDLSATRAWASRNQTPASVLLLLGVCAVVSCGLMGHSSGQADTRHLGLWSALNILLVLVLFVVLDFDRPRRGLIQVDHSPLLELRQTMTP